MNKNLPYEIISLKDEETALEWVEHYSAYIKHNESLPFYFDPLRYIYIIYEDGTTYWRSYKIERGILKFENIKTIVCYNYTEFCLFGVVDSSVLKEMREFAIFSDRFDYALSQLGDNAKKDELEKWFGPDDFGDKYLEDYLSGLGKLHKD